MEIYYVTASLLGTLPYAHYGISPPLQYGVLMFSTTAILIVLPRPPFGLAPKRKNDMAKKTATWWSIKGKHINQDRIRLVVTRGTIYRCTTVFCEVPQCGSFKTCFNPQKLIWTKKHNFYRTKNLMAWVHDENHAKKKWRIIYFFSRRFWVEEPRHSKNKIARKR